MVVGHLLTLIEHQLQILATPPQSPQHKPSISTCNSPNTSEWRVSISQTTFNNEKGGKEKKFWNIEHRFAGSPDYEFVIYVNRPETISMSITKGTVIMRPVLLEDIYGQGFVTKPLNLGDNCTGVLGSSSANIIRMQAYFTSPVLSSRINTRNKFSFRYGKIEINAKLPKGELDIPRSRANEYRRYGLTWKPDSITLSVDDRVYGTIYPLQEALQV
ncbi:hypothetical protein NQ317_003311 [Molorchus minor]|uniref:Uncharacterized protein n=1 Tax=Molorchus minor TaxID=1323400 RepID=A0ABQ9IRY6_9CUCU|nr:hypothetical protein NQ317_003311 [Molorchus minor]